MACFACCFGSAKNQDDDFDYVSYRARNNNTTLTPPDVTKDSNIPRCTIEELRTKLGNQETGDPDSLMMIPESQRGSPHPPAPHLTSDGLIVPRKLHNPVLVSPDRQNLHRELLFNQKIGKNVLNQKSELQRALEKLKTNTAKKEYETNINSMTPELEKVIADRAKKRQEVTGGSTENEDDKGLNKEFLQARAKLKARADAK